MNLKEFNSLVDLFFYKAAKENPDADFLEWLNPKNKKKYNWGETTASIQKLAKVLKDNLVEGDRCLLVSENRPEWLIADLAIMLADGITVPAYTTYTEKDYKYLIEDCEPTVIIVSNNEMHKKLKNIIKEKDFIKKVITFDELNNVEKQDKYLKFNSIISSELSKNEKIKNTIATNVYPEANICGGPSQVGSSKDICTIPRRSEKPIRRIRVVSLNTLMQVLTSAGTELRIACGKTI